MHHENEKMALFEALYREYLVPLKKYAYRIGVGYDDIEDMVHEAFIEYYKRYSLDLDHKVKLVLLIRILRSKWIDNRRQMRRREMLHLEDPDAEEEIMNLLFEGEIGIQLLDQEVIDRDIYWNITNLENCLHAGKLRHIQLTAIQLFHGRGIVKGVVPAAVTGLNMKIGGIVN